MTRQHYLVSEATKAPDGPGSFKGHYDTSYQVANRCLIRIIAFRGAQAAELGPHFTSSQCEASIGPFYAPRLKLCARSLSIISRKACRT